MPSYPHFEVVKSVLNTAKKEKLGLKVIYSGKTVGELSFVDRYEEYYGQITIYGSESNAILIHASEVRYLSVTTTGVLLQLKMYPALSTSDSIGT